MSDWADLLKRHIDDPKTDARITEYFSRRGPMPSSEIQPECMTFKPPTEEQIAHFLKEIETILEEKYDE